MKNIYFIIFSLLFLVFKCECQQDNNKDSNKLTKEITQNIYYNIKNDTIVNIDAVFSRILNANTVIGSKPSSSTGIIYSIDSEEEFYNFINDPKMSGKFAIILPAMLVNRANLRKLEESKKVVGVVVVYDGKLPKEPYSPDKKCPNCEFGLYTEGERANYKWNSYGDGMLYDSFDFPIFGITGSGYSINEVLLPIIEANIFNKRRKYKEYPLYSIKFNSFMLASKDSITCLERETCDPIGGNSIWGSFSDTISPDDGKKIVFVTAQLDGNSLFHENTVGTNSHIGGIVANLAIVDALSRSDIKPDQFQNHIVFMFFNGESYGYGGSQRFVNDISEPFICNEKKNSPNNASCQKPYMYYDEFKNISLDNIKGIIELNQLTCSGCNDINNPTYFMHVDDEKDEETLKIINLISKVNSAYGNSVPVVSSKNSTLDINDNNSNNIDNNNKDNITENKLKRQESTSYNIKPAWIGIPKNLGLPPSSSHSFLKKKKIPAVVISDFQSEFTNKYYNSGFDIDSNTTVYNNTVCKTADIIAKSIWLYAQNKEADYDINLIPASVNVDCNYVNELMYCLSHNITCTRVQSLFNLENDSLTKVSHYTGVFNKNSINGYNNSYDNFDSWVTNFELARAFGKKTNYTCNKNKDCICDKNKDCKTVPKDPKKQYQCINNFCYEAKVYSHPAYGTGIRYDEAKEKFLVWNSSEPTWTESRCSDNMITICFTTSRAFQLLELFLGIVCVVLTIIGYYFINYYTRKYVKLA